MADGRHIENRFLAISRRHIGRLMRNLDGRWRITCRYVTWPKRQFLTNYRWQTAAILKIALSPYLSRELSDFDFRSSLGCRCEFPSREWSMTEILHSRWHSDAILKIGNQLYLGANFGRFTRNLYRNTESHADMVYVTKTELIDNSTSCHVNSSRRFRIL